LIFQFWKSVKVSLKSKPQMEILLAVDKILMVLSKDSYSKSSRDNPDLMSQRIKLQSKDSEKLLRKPKLSYHNQLKLK
jgi:hypothetical protein